jgi:hypothetical protein
MVGMQRGSGSRALDRSLTGTAIGAGSLMTGRSDHSAMVRPVGNPHTVAEWGFRPVSCGGPSRQCWRFDVRARNGREGRSDEERWFAQWLAHVTRILHAPEHWNGHAARSEIAERATPRKGAAVTTSCARRDARRSRRARGGPGRSLNRFSFESDGRLGDAFCDRRHVSQSGT